MGVMKRLYTDRELRKQYAKCFITDTDTPKLEDQKKSKSVRPKKALKFKKKGGTMGEQDPTWPMWKYVLILWIAAGLTITVVAAMLGW